ncbi:hypothetical protein Pla123a_05280 [Posidoniimonas polymericola]|uniref:Uncharacterized protein n=1 Tax=Posidoniimonas polymericola TaxID=2528002 RepID=A0A5C5ZFU1_9BACT|nr:hypothetical protein [Posidoniimonas polymericola]TWT85721.1 hypothetical protein Pla123a_05280 [Posidoniimonas polymericola]
MSMPTDNPNAYDAPEAPPEKKPKGCMFWGCLIVGIGGVLMLLLLVGGGFGAYFWAKGQIEQYTSTEPAEIPVSEATDEEIAEIQARVDALQQAVENDQPAAQNEVVLTADDINALIASNQDMKGKVYVTIENGEVTGDVSMPLDDLPMGKGRFLNAKVTLNASYEDGVPIVTLKGGSVKGQPLPQQFIDALANENLAKDLLKDPKVAEKLRKFDSIKVEGDKIILRLKEPADGEAPAGAEGPAAGETAEPVGAGAAE